MKFDKAFAVGIRSDDRSQPNTQALVSCTGSACGEHGLVPFRNVGQPITDAALTTAVITKSYPWPQLIRGRSITILADERGLWQVTESPTGNWTITAITLYDWTTYNWDADSASTTTIPANGYDWHFVDNFNSWMLFNGVCVIFKTGFSNKTFIQSTVTINTGSVYQGGKLFMGGFNSANVESLAAWNTYLSAIYSGGTLDEVDKLVNISGTGTNWVWWGVTGFADMLRFFSLDYMKYMSLAATPDTGFDDDSPFWHTLALRRESHFAPMPFSGSVAKMMQLGDAMVVYGTDGLAALLPANTAMVKTFGVHEIGGISPRAGVARGTNTAAAVGGDDRVHGLIDEAGDFWIITPDMRAEKAGNGGYRHLFSGVDDLLVHYNPNEKEFHLTGAGNVSYRFRNGSMSRDPRRPTTVGYGRYSSVSGPIGIYDSSGVTTSTWTTEWFDGGQTGVVPEVRAVHIEASDGWTIGINYKRAVDDSTQTATSITLGKKRKALFKTSGVLFQITGSHAAPTTATFRSAEVEFGDGTRRSITPWNL